MPQLIPQRILDSLGLTLGVVVLIRLTTLLTSKKSRNERTLRVWLFALSTSLFAALELDETYIAVDRYVGLNNVAWLLAYICLVTSAYLLCSFSSPRQPRWTLPGLAVTAGSLAAAFLFGPARTPEWPNHFIAQNLGEIVFTALAYGYVVGVLSGVSIRSMVTLYRRNQGNFHVRLRTSMGLLAAMASAAFYVVRFAIFSLSLLTPSVQSFATASGADIYRGLAIAAVIFWAVFFGMSDRFYLNLARLEAFARKLVILKRLEALRSELDTLCPSLLPFQATWPEQVRNADFYIYQHVIFVLDAKRKLANWHSGRVNVAADGRGMKKATRLHAALQRVPDSLNYDDLVAAYQGLGGQMRRGKGDYVTTVNSCSDWSRQ